MSANFLPGGPCLCCLMPRNLGKGNYPTTRTDGVLNMIAGAMASIQSAEAVKIITGSPNVRKTLLVMDIWRNKTEYIDIYKDLKCPVCGYA
jgi:adenylyltransferase/sulfurtransferase